jgi:signal transduction histidine kinase
MIEPIRQPDTIRQLALVQQLGQLLLTSSPLPQRLTALLTQLRAALPFVAARAIVLADAEPWSLDYPPRAEQPVAGATPEWPRALTAELLRRDAPLLQPLDPQRRYLGWLITWQMRRCGAIEFIVAEAGVVEELSAIMEALNPLLASALSLPAPTASQAEPARSELLDSDQRQLSQLAAQFETPLLLQPLLSELLQQAMARSAAACGALHLAESNGHGLHLLTFELPVARPADNGQPSTLLSSSRTHDLAKIALANNRAMIRQVGDETHFAAPIVHDGRLLGAIALEGVGLQQQALLFVQRLAELAGPALLRAQFYQQLADARTHLQQVFDELPTGLALTDRDGRLLRANPSWWRLWDIAPGEVAAIKLVPWDILPRLLSRLPDPLAFSDLFTNAAEQPSEALLALQNPWQELRLLIVPVRDALGLQAGFLLAADDVTREREVDRLQSEFVSVVSHELRTPLTSILGYTELLLAREFDPSERREFIQTVYKEADHLSSLVEDLLNVSRLDAGKIKLERWIMALPKLVRELVAQLNTELDVERHRMLLDVPDNLPPIYADRDRVRQILSNLLSNAIKYSPEGGEVVLQATVLQRPAGNATLSNRPASAPPLPPEPAMLISVRDRGIGIPQHELTRIFERFYRVDNSNTRRIGGTGLGLAITRALVELHGGRIWAESTPGEGSTFYVTLPLATEMLRTRP